MENIELIADPGIYPEGELKKIYHDYLLKRVGFEGCDACSTTSCCTSFYYVGPRVDDFEKEMVLDNIEKLGRRYDHIRGIINKTSYIPTKGRKQSSKRCQLLADDGRCMVYESRPDVCREFPLWLDIIDNVLAVTFDTSCRTNTQKIGQELKKLDNMIIDGYQISIGYQDSNELRSVYYLGDER
ncbi:MAG: YkgJ family cysteine cluster protein [Nanoarchaeota archaeon]|nr:YkgJ family cysteine cluster protein [Nanoarchaeota archaeon]